MKPIELRLEGLTSFRQQTIIDFSQLELFAITGPTGAGKSSLIDAITLALYGKVARGIKPDELLSSGSDKLQVTFRFLVDDVEYQVSRTWSYRTKTPKTTFKLDRGTKGNSKSFGEQKAKDITANIEKLLSGMKFDTFTKVILLPQGKFDKFLRAETSDDRRQRRDILRKLAGFQIFEDMRAEAEKQANLLDKEYQGMESQLEHLDILPPEELDNQRRQYQILVQNGLTLEEKLEKARKELDEAQKLWERLNHLKQLQKQHVQLSQKTPEIEKLAQQLEQARVADRLRGIWVKVDKARKRYEQAKVAVKEATTQLNKMNKSLKTQENKRQQAQTYQAEMEPQIKAREQALNAAQIYEEQRQQIETEVKRQQLLLDEKATQLLERQKVTKEAETKSKRQKNALEKANQKLAQYTQGGERLEKLNEVTPFLIQWEGIEKEVNNERHQLQQTSAQITTEETTYQKVIVKFEKAEAVFQSANDALQQAQTNNATAVLRLSLQLGDNCPVCGGYYPDTDALPALSDSSLAQIDTLRKQQVKAEKALEKVKSSKIQSEAKLDNLKQNQLQFQQKVTARETELADVEQQINTLLPEETWEVEALTQQRQTLEESDKNYQKAFSHQQQVQTKFDKAQQALEFAQQRSDDAQTDYQEAEQNVAQQTLKQQDVEAKLYELTQGESYETLSQTLEREKQTLARQLDKATQSYQAAYDKFIQAEVANKTAQDEVEVAHLDNEQQETEWANHLQTEGFTEAKFSKAQTTPKTQAKWQKQIDEHRHQQDRLEIAIKAETDEIGDRSTDKSQIAQHQTTKKEFENTLQQTRKDMESLSVAIQMAEKDQKLAQDLKTELTKKQAEKNTYRTLANDLRKDKFQEYILEDFEKELVAQATILLLELSGKRYTLKYSDNDYWVEDHWNAGEPRRIQTLSGGETFATSLAMALALSEKLSQGAKLGCLFVDEGFGTLDTETLESVTHILESLQQQDRLIGVITHIPALAERLPKQIKVHKSQDGSRLTIDTK